MEPRKGQFHNLFVVLSLHQEMGISLDADIGQMDQGRIAAVAVDGIDELPGHGEFRPPLVFAYIVGADLDIVAVKRIIPLRPNGASPAFKVS